MSSGGNYVFVRYFAHMKSVVQQSVKIAIESLPLYKIFSLQLFQDMTVENRASKSSTEQEAKSKYYIDPLWYKLLKGICCSLQTTKKCCGSMLHSVLKSHYLTSDGSVDSFLRSIAKNLSFYHLTKGLLSVQDQVNCT